MSSVGCLIRFTTDKYVLGVAPLDICRSACVGMKRIKAVGLLSGGLDSTLAVKLMLDQGIEVHAVNFTSLLHQRGEKKSRAEVAAKAFKIPLRNIELGSEYLRIVRHPKHGYGSGMNPCIDCHALMLRKAKQYARQIGADFIFTGEVLGERPMSQHRVALNIVEKESGLEGKVLRPLSARLLPETEAEREGWVDRCKLFEIQGRSRKPQMELAKKLGIADYSPPGGGCLLTEKEFSARMKDLLSHRKRISKTDILLLKVGRQFRIGENRIIVGRDEAENKTLLGLDSGHLTYLEALGINGPVTVLQGRPRRSVVLVAARLTARYCDGKETVVIGYRCGKRRGSVKVERMPDSEVQAHRIAGTNERRISSS